MSPPTGRMPRARGYPLAAILAALLAATALTVTPAITGTSAQADPVASTVVSLTFDDGARDEYVNARPILDARGVRATFFINSGRVNAPGFMSRSELATLAAQGHEIAGHTVSHPDLPTMSADDQRREICNDRVALLNMGFQVTNLAYPYGAANATTRQVAAECGYNSARTVGGIVSPGACAGCAFSETIPPAQPYLTRTPDSVKTDTSLDALKNYVTQAEQHGGGWVQLVMHHVCDGCGDAYAISPATLSALLDWLAPRAANGTHVKTVNDVIGGAVKPGVPGPPLPVPADGNLVQNASLESVGASNVPTCFQLGGFGTNTFTWTRTSDAHTGSYGEQLTITAYTSGDRKLVTKQDAGSCVPPAVGGHTYRVGVWYKGSWAATVNTRIVLYYRSGSGAWVYWTSGPLVPATGTWTQTSVVTPAVPAGATGLSFGLALAGPGTLYTDDYSVVDLAG